MAQSKIFEWIDAPDNGLATTYVSHEGNDSTGTGTGRNPFATIAAATAAATAGTNIMLDAGVWGADRTANNRAFKFWGNGQQAEIRGGLTVYADDEFNGLTLTNICNKTAKATNCRVWNGLPKVADHCAIRTSSLNLGGCTLTKCVLLADGSLTFTDGTATLTATDTVFICSGVGALGNASIGYCNFTTQTPPTGASHCISNTDTAQTFADYFNAYKAAPTTTKADFLLSDFTAKAGSGNLGAGTDHTTIGWELGFPSVADNSATDIFKAANGATLLNVRYDATLGGYVIDHKSGQVQSVTNNTNALVTLESTASATDDAYNGLQLKIVSGYGAGQHFAILDYDGATRTATLNGQFTDVPDLTSTYAISGRIISAEQQFGGFYTYKNRHRFTDCEPDTDGAFSCKILADHERTPASYPEYLQLWLRADNVVLTDGKVSRWPDMSPNNYQIVQTTANARPTIGAGINGKPALAFNGTSQWLNGGNILSLGATPWTWLIVGQYNTGSQSGVSSPFFCGKYDRYEDWGYYPLWYVGKEVWVVWWEGSTQCVVNFSNNYTSTDFAVFGYEILNHDTRQQSTLVNNKTTNTKTSADAFQSPYDSSIAFKIGWSKVSTTQGQTGLYLNGQIAEIIALNTVDEAMRNNIYNYLARRYGFSSSSSSSIKYQVDFNL